MVIAGLLGVLNLESEEARAEIWYFETVDSAGDVGLYNSITLDNRSYPHIAYFDNITHDLKYAKWTGSDWDIETVDSTGSVGYYSTLALDISGYPHIGYYDFDNRDLKYAKWTGSRWDIDTVDSAGDVGHFSSIALDSSYYPHIGYYDNNTFDLKYAKWTGSRWNIETVDSEGDVGWYASIALDSNDDPHISYMNNESFDIKYAKRTGSSWSIETVALPKYIGFSTSLAIDSNDNPHISYFDLYVSDFAEYIYYNVKYARWTGFSWDIKTVDETDNGGYSAPLVLDSNDQPHLCYCYDNPYDDFYIADCIEYARWNGYSWDIEPVGLTGDVGYYTSIALDSRDYPHITFYDSTQKTLKYATIQKPPNKPNTPSGPLNGKVDISYSYSVSATDPNGDQIKYVFDWGDGTTSETDYVDSGTTEIQSHNWTSKGTYNLTVRAVDIHDESSELSDNVTVVIRAKDLLDDDVWTLLLFVIIGIIITAFLAFAFTYNRKSKKSTKPASQYPKQQYAYAQQQYTQQYPRQTAQPTPAQPQYSQMQIKTLQVSCPKCSHAFYVRGGPGTHQIQCPNCGIAGVMNL